MDASPRAAGPTNLDLQVARPAAHPGARATVTTLATSASIVFRGDAIALTGEVHEVSGAPVSGGTVQLLLLDASRTRAVRRLGAAAVGADGRFRAELLCPPDQEPGGYELVAEFLGTGLLVSVVVGSGIAAASLSAGDVGLQLLENSTATVFGLAVLITVFGPVSGAHFNPVVSAVDWWLGRRAGTGLPGVEVAAYSAAQVVGGVSGAVLANL